MSPLFYMHTKGQNTPWEAGNGPEVIAGGASFQQMGGNSRYGRGEITVACEHFAIEKDNVQNMTKIGWK